MKDDKIKNYLLDLIVLIKEQAKETKFEADNPKKVDEDYNTGFLMAYHTVISLMKHQVFGFQIDENELGLADIEPERDLL